VGSWISKKTEIVEKSRKLMRASQVKVMVKFSCTKRTRELMRLSREIIRLLVEIISGHDRLNRQLGIIRGD